VEPFRPFLPVGVYGAYVAGFSQCIREVSPCPAGGIFPCGQLPGHKAELALVQVGNSIRKLFSGMTLFNPYFDRDLSWLSFNDAFCRAADPRVPLYDR
jgi:hypothetical protein